MNHKLELQEINIEDLIYSEYNPRVLSEKEYKNIKNSLIEFGVLENIIVNKNPKRFNIIIGGHQRVKIMKDLGYKTVQVHYVDIEDIKKEQELNIRLNKNQGEWDFNLLSNIDENILNIAGFNSYVLYN